MNRRLVAAWAGLLGPALFVATFTVEGWLRPDYDAKSTFVSALSLGPRGFIQVVNFVVLGALLLVFAQGVAAEFREGTASRAGPVLLAIIGASYLLSGPCVMDPMRTPRDQMTVHGMLHGIFGALVFSLSPATCFVFLRRFRADPRWRSLAGWTLAAGAISVAAVVLLRVGPTRPPSAPNAFDGWVGVVQRAAIITNLSWVFAFALALLRRST
jgi:hypothetical protein